MESSFARIEPAVDYVIGSANVADELVFIEGPHSVGQCIVRYRSSDFVGLRKPQYRFKRRAKVAYSPSVPFFRRVRIPATVENYANTLSTMWCPLANPTQHILKR